VNAHFEYASARYQQAREIAMQAESTARRARHVRQSAERLLSHHLSVLVEQHGQWADTPEQGTTFACAQSAVEQWRSALEDEMSATGRADYALAHANELHRDVLDASRPR